MVDAEGKLPNGEPYGPSLTLGAAEVSPLDMAAAYGVFSARGMQFAASPVLRVLGADGQVLEDNRARPGRRVLNETIADQMNDVLKGVVAKGTGKAADIGRPNGTAGKTGTSENFSDAWFVGYTPELSTSVWMGFADSQRPLTNIKGLARIYGGTLPAKTWHDYMASALEGKPATDFAPPAAPPPPSFEPSPARGSTPSTAPPATVEPGVDPYTPAGPPTTLPDYFVTRPATNAPGDVPAGTPFFPPPVEVQPPPTAPPTTRGLIPGLLRP
jgi:penicillin-binding protein 1A